MPPHLLVTCNPAENVPSGAADGEWAGATACDLLQHLHKPAFSAQRPSLPLWDGERPLRALDEPLPVGATLRVVSRRQMDRPLSKRALLRLAMLDLAPCSLHLGMRTCEALFKPVQVRWRAGASCSGCDAANC